ncbi:hypothetical protein LIER_26374 [Lithospermum erythrorhizon]|uniref:Uncharacterized protein n=1 Tax=Lithospermum erythrorhizon TaxID=34254 RepID=A0AAV3R853_LITER
MLRWRRRELNCLCDEASWDFCYGEATHVNRQSPFCRNLYCNRFVGPDPNAVQFTPPPPQHQPETQTCTHNLLPLQPQPQPQPQETSSQTQATPNDITRLDM